MSEFITTLQEQDVNFIWVSDHYDYHKNGLCLYRGKYCEFKGKEVEIKNNNYIFNNVYYDIYKLSFKEKIKWLYNKKIFEWCVGYHWSYPKNSNKKIWDSFHTRKPNWFFSLLLKFFYKIDD